MKIMTRFSATAGGGAEPLFPYLFPDTATVVFFKKYNIRRERYELGNPEGHRPAFRLRDHDVRCQPLIRGCNRKNGGVPAVFFRPYIPCGAGTASPAGVPISANRD
jgi:hypothetical protein